MRLLRKRAGPRIRCADARGRCQVSDSMETRFSWATQNHIDDVCEAERPFLPDTWHL